jgi:DNA segregation ATPase FtsK/SpoIIIE-like protein
LLGGSYSQNNYDEMAGERDDIDPIIHQSVEIKQEASKPDQNTPPISFLTDTSVDNYFNNKSEAEKSQTVIAKFIKKLGVESSYQKTTIMPQYTEINFEVDSKTSIDEILKSQNELLRILKLESFNISFKGNVVRFELPNKDSSKISMRQILNSVSNIQPNESIVGLTLENTPLVLDIHKHPNSVIIGRRGSGGAMLLTCMLISLAYLNAPSHMDFIILSPLGDKSLKHLDSLPHMQYPVISELDESVAKMHDVLKTIDDREGKLKEAGAKTLEEYNKYQSVATARLKEVVLVISSYDKLLKNNLQNVEILSEILQRGSKVGITVILLAINVNNESVEPKIYDQTVSRFILRLESEHESLKMFDSYRGVQLCGNGDGYYIDANSNKKTRFQACYLNANELVETIKIIKTFYLTKEQQV